MLVIFWMSETDILAMSYKLLLLWEVNCRLMDWENNHLLVRCLSSGIDSSVADSLFHVLSHGGAWSLSAQTWVKAELQEEKNSNANLKQWEAFSCLKEEGIKDASA